jgi:hypothetical protein
MYDHVSYYFKSNISLIIVNMILLNPDIPLQIWLRIFILSGDGVAQSV